MFEQSVLSLAAKTEISSFVDGKTIFITGGTGSYGNKLVRALFSDFQPKKVVVFSRDELKQSVMKDELCTEYGEDLIGQRMRWFLGCIRDYDRLLEACSGVDVIFHAAALKQVPALEYNPFEAIMTNILGANNLIRAAVARGVGRVIALSTDKAAAPVNLYGATKLCQDKLMVSANHMHGSLIRIGVVRYGNVFGSRGSVVPVFEKMVSTGKIGITDERMTRFSITLEQGVAFSLNCLSLLQGGEIFIPRLPSYKITAIGEVYSASTGCKVELVGIRPGEKLHEVMVPGDEAGNTLEFSDYYIIGQAGQWYEKVKQHYIALGGIPCAHGFEYSSETNRLWLSATDIEQQIREYRGQKA